MTKDEIIKAAKPAEWLGCDDGWTFNSYKQLEDFVQEIENRIEREYADMLTIAHMDGYERGRDAGIKQEQALWKLAETSQEIGYDK
jgi:hypothetical protein